MIKHYTKRIGASIAIGFVVATLVAVGVHTYVKTPNGVADTAALVAVESAVDMTGTADLALSAATPPTDSAQQPTASGNAAPAQPAEPVRQAVASSIGSAPMLAAVLQSGADTQIGEGPALAPFATSPADSEDERRDDSPERNLLAISGTIMNETGEPVPDIEVIAERTRLAVVDGIEVFAYSEREQRTWTAGDGYYQFAQLTAGEYQIRTDDWPPYTPARVTVRAGTEAVDLVVFTERQLWVHGVIRDTDGAPLEGVAIRPRSGSAEPAYSDAEGRYGVAVSLPGSRRNVFSVAYRREGYKEAVLRVGRADYEALDEVQLDARMEPLALGVRVSGRVRGSAGGVLARQRVTLSSQQAKSRYTAITDRAGRFALANVAKASDYRLQVRPQGQFQDYVKNGLVVEAQGLSLPIVLEPLGVGSLSGQMLDPDGKPIPNFSLWLRSREAIRQTVRVTSDREGYFFVRAAPQGVLSMRTQSSPHFSVKDIYLPAGEEAFVELVLDTGLHELFGRVEDSFGEPVAVADVRLTWNHRENGVSSSANRKTAADAQGYFRFTGLGSGLHKIMINNAAGFRTIVLAHEVGADSADEVVVTLREAYQ